MHSVIACLLAHSRARPDAAAFVSGARIVTYAALVRSVRAAAAWLHARGIRPGDTVVLPMDEGSGSELPLMCLIYGAGWLGAGALALEPGTPPATSSALLHRTDGAKPIQPAQFDAQAASHGEPPARADDGARPFLHVFSSGTTGTPKQMAFTHAGLVAYAQKYQRALGHGPGDRFLPPGPFPSKTGLRYLWLAHAAGATLVNQPFPRRKVELARLIRDLGVTAMVCAPPQLRRLMRSEMPPGERLPPLRRLISGAAYMSYEEIRTVREALTPNLYRTYASTECGVVALLRPEDPAEAKSGVGRLLPEVEAQVAGDDGAPLAPGQVGYLGFRTACIPLGYIGNAQATARHFRDGWFYPGDLGSIDAAGTVSLAGRADHVINFGGVMIVPEDIEAVLTAHPKVGDAALVGVKHKVLGELPVAAVVLRGNLPMKELRSYCAQTIEKKRMPAIFVVVQDIPRDATGKLRHALLRDHVTRLVIEGADRGKELEQ